MYVIHYEIFSTFLSILFLLSKKMQISRNITLCYYFRGIIYISKGSLKHTSHFKRLLHQQYADNITFTGIYLHIVCCNIFLLTIIKLLPYLKRYFDLKKIIVNQIYIMILVYFSFIFKITFSIVTTVDTCESYKTHNNVTINF